MECDTDAARGSSLRIAWDLLRALRTHRDEAGWDLGDICLAQYEEVVGRLVAGEPGPAREGASAPAASDAGGGGGGHDGGLPPGWQLQDAGLMAELFPGLWENSGLEGWS